jgi:hypothetical protein
LRDHNPVSVNLSLSSTIGETGELAAEIEDRFLGEGAEDDDEAVLFAWTQ